MVQDLGGARYPIEVVDQFTGPLAALKVSLAEVRAQFDELRAAGQPFDKLRKSSAEITQTIDAQTEGFKRNAAAARNMEIALHQQVAALETGVAALKAKIKEESAHEAGLRAAAAAIRKQAVEEAKLQALAAAGVATEREKAAAIRDTNAARKDAAAAAQRQSAAELAGAKDFVANAERFRQAELEALKKNIQLREQSRLSQPEARSGLSDERIQIAAEQARAEAAIDAQSNDRRIRTLREDIQARHGAGAERVKIATETARAEAAIDAQARTAANARLREDIQARAAAAAQARKQADALTASSAAGQSQATIAADFARLEKAKATISAAERGVAVLPKTLREARNEVRALTTDMEAANASGNRISFTFRRLFGILAAFTIAREALRFFKELLTGGVAFNAQLEQASLGIASIVAATGELRDINGQNVEGAQAFVLAQKEARRQMQLLRIDSLRTSSSLQDLVFAFQTAIGPGIQAGLNLDEVRKFSVQISQAATAIGLSQNQLAEEIRSILQGTIQARTTRIATVLGISNEDIKRAKEAGRLVEFLNLRFKAFSKAAEEGSNNLTNIFARLKNAIGLVLGAGSEQLFESLRDGLRGILDSIVQVQDEKIIINPKAIAIVREIQDGLSDALKIGLELTRSVSFEDAIDTARGIGDVFRAVATIAKPFIQGVTQALGDVAKLTKPLTDFFSSSAGSFIGIILGQLVRVLAIVSSIGLALKLFVSPLTIAFSIVQSLRTQFGALKTAIDASATSSGKLRTALQGVGIAVTLGLLFNQLDDQVKKARETIDFFFKEKLPAEAKITQQQAAAISLTSARATVGQIDQEEFVRQLRFFRAEIIKEFDRDTNATVKKGSLLDVIEELPATIARTKHETDDLVNTLKELGFERSEAERTLASFLETPEASGASSQISQDRLRAQIEIEKKGLELDGQRDELQARLNAVKSRQFAIDQKILALHQEDRDTLDLFLLSAKNLAALEQRRSSAQASGTTTEALDQEIEQLKNNIRTILTSKEVRSGVGEQIREIARDQLTLDAQTISDQESLETVTNKRLRLEQAILGLLRIRNDLVAGGELVSLREQNDQLALRIGIENRLRQSRLSQTEEITDSPIRTQLAEARNILDARELENRRALVKVEADLVRLNRDKATTTGDISQVEFLITEKERERALLMKDQVDNLGAIRDRLRELERAADSFGSALELGLRASLAQFAASAPDAFQTAFSAMTTLLDGIVNISRDAFASIFDPNSNFSIKEALGRLALEIASNLFADAVKSLIAGLITTTATTEGAAVVAATTLQGGGVAAGAAMIAGATTAAGILAGSSATSTAMPLLGTSFAARGGRVPEPVYRARGGYGAHPGRPRGTDTVPAWLTPDEFVVRARQASRAPVLRVLNAINEGRVPDGILNAVSESTGAMRIAPRTAQIQRNHFAGGGQVGGGGGGMQILPVAVTDQKMFDLLLTQGEGQLMRFLADRGVPMGQR